MKPAPPRTPLQHFAETPFGRRLARLTASGVRATLHGDENVPRSGGALVVGNHGYGGVDALGLASLLTSETGRAPRFLAERNFFRWPGLARFYHAAGGVPGAPDTAVALLEAGELVVVYPGGTDDAFKASSEAYVLQWGSRAGFARAAMRARAPIIPVAALGIDELFRISGREPWIGRRIFGSSRYDLPVVTGMASVPLDYHALAPIDTSGDPDDAAAVERVRRATKEALEAVLAAHREGDRRSV